MGKTTEELYNASLKRVNDAIALKVPDRVPIIPVIQAFPMYNSGITIKDAMYDYKGKATLAFDKFFEEFKPDLGWDPISVSYTHLRAHETDSYLVCRLLLEK